MTPAPTIPAAALQDAIRDVLAAAGAHAVIARDVAHALVSASLRGIDSHGVALLSRILVRVDTGRSQVTTPAATVVDFGAITVMDAHLAPGQHAGMAVAEVAAARAEAFGIGMSCVRNSTHFGAAAPFVAAIVRQGMIGFVGSNSTPSMAAFGATGANLGNNPFGFGAPVADGPDCIVDVSCGVMSFGQLNQIRARGEDVPSEAFAPNEALPGSAIYEIAGALEYAARPFGGYKGASLAIMVETLAGILSSGNVGHACEAMRDDVFLGPSHFAIAFNPKAFAVDALADAIADYLGGIRSGYGGVRLPGDRSAETMAKRTRSGIPLDGETWESLHVMCERFGTALPGTAVHGAAR